MQKINAQCKGIVVIKQFGVSIEASKISSVQGLDPKENFQPFIWLVCVKECISQVSWDPRDLACLS